MANYGHKVRQAREAAKAFRVRPGRETEVDRAVIERELIPALGRDPTNKEVDVFMWFVRGFDGFNTWSYLRKYEWEM